MEFLKDVLGDKYGEFETAIKAYNETQKEDAKKIKLANLAAGEYTSTAKYNDLLKDRDTFKSGLSDANKQIEGFKNMKVEDIQKAADDYKAKFEQAEAQRVKDVDALKFTYSLENALKAAKAKNAKAVKALLKTEDLKLTDDGIIGLKEQLETIKKDNEYLFDTDDNTSPSPTFGGGTGRQNQNTNTDDFIHKIMDIKPEKK